MPKFRKIPKVIEAVRWDGSEKALAEIIGFRSECSVRVSFGANSPLVIGTLEGAVTAQLGDWVICGVHRELYPCKPDIFSETYESVELDDAPKTYRTVCAKCSADLNDGGTCSCGCEVTKLLVKCGDDYREVR